MQDRKAHAIHMVAIETGQFGGMKPNKATYFTISITTFSIIIEVSL